MPEAQEPVTEPVPPRATRAWGIGLALFVLAIAGLLVWARLRTGGTEGGGPGGRGPGAGAQPVPVRMVHPETRDVPIYLEGIGTVTSLESAIVRPRVDGPLDRVLFTEGQDVHAGDVLAEIDARPFRVALAQAQAVLARDEASLVQARATRDRGRQLHAHELLSTQDLEAQEGSVASLEATVRADRAAVDSARLSVTYAHVTAPIDGLTGLRQIDPGNLVSSTDPNGIVVITRIDPIAVVFTLPQDDLGSVVREMANGSLAVEVLSRDGSDTLATGTLTVIDNRIEPTTGTIRLRAQVPNADRGLWPNQLVEVRMLLETRHGVLTVPDAAVQQGPDGTFVYVVGADHTASVRAVRIDRTVGELAIVADGLAASDEIVSEGQSRLRPGAEVRLEGEALPDAGVPAGGAGPRRGGRAP
jgi:multidrug efflux system membrane fusion protein